MRGDGGAGIVVVDDLAMNVRLLEAVLGARGYDVVSARGLRAPGYNVRERAATRMVS